MPVEIPASSPIPGGKVSTMSHFFRTLRWSRPDAADHMPGKQGMITHNPKPEADYVDIRGRRLALAQLVDPRIFDDAFIGSLRLKFHHAAPYPHLRMEGLFNPTLLELVFEEFDLFPGESWQVFNNHHERTFRSVPGARMGPASELYFSIVNSGYFVDFLSRITGERELIVDQKLFGGGLHESRNDGRFGVHRDFERHDQTGLRNEMVLLTYLNKNWNRDWGGELELWDHQAKECVTRVAPDFGVSLLMKNGPHHFHGHPNPLRMPEGRLRRSLGTYYYANPEAVEQGSRGTTTTFLHARLPHSLKSSATRLAKRWTPPAIWDAARKIKRRFDRQRFG